MPEPLKHVAILVHNHRLKYILHIELKCSKRHVTESEGNNAIQVNNNAIQVSNNAMQVKNTFIAAK